MTQRKITFIYSDEAFEDLDDIYTYIAVELQEKRIAANLVKRIRKEIRELEPFSEMFPLVDWEPWHSEGVRRMLVGNYSVYYLPDRKSNSVSIIRIFYSGRDIEHIINGEDE